MIGVKTYLLTRNNNIIIFNIRSVLVTVVNVFLVTHPQAILEAACFVIIWHSACSVQLQRLIVSILSVVCPGNVQIVQDMLR